MYANLRLEMIKNKISIDSMAEELGIHRNSVSNKINGGKFNIEEAFKIQTIFFPKLQIQYLFKKSQSEQQKGE